MTRFTLAELERASDTWFCNCGPAALAAICGLTLDEVRLHFGPDWPGYTNPTAMRRALTTAGRQFTIERLGVADREWPRWGLVRIQFEGPWTEPGASPRWAYRHTHWVAVWRAFPAICVFDVNSMEYDDDSGWLPLLDWERCTVPLLTDSIPRATGGWRITHAIEVER